jgi:hypothetical protein
MLNRCHNIGGRLERASYREEVGLNEERVQLGRRKPSAVVVENLGLGAVLSMPEVETLGQPVDCCDAMLRVIMKPCHALRATSSTFEECLFGLC